MHGSRFIEVFGHIIFSFTRSVSEQYSPNYEDSEYSQETSEYSLLQNTGREWYAQPVDEIIYQEYSDKEVTVHDFLPASLNAGSRGEIAEQGQNQEADLDRAMSWKQLRPSPLRTICNSTVIGASISLLSAIAIGMLFTVTSYVSYKTFLNCHFQNKTFIPLELQWVQVTCNIISCFFLYTWMFLLALVLFRSYQLSGVKKELFRCCILMYFLDSLYRVTLQAMEISKSFPLSDEQVIPLNILFILSILVHNYLLANHLYLHSNRQKCAFFRLFSAIYCLPFIVGIIFASRIYPAYINQDKKGNEKGKLIIAVFSPLIGVALKTSSRICVQRLWRITHPAYSYVMMAPLYGAAAVMSRVMQVDLEDLGDVALVGIIHGVAEVIERSTVVVIDDLCQRILKRTSVPWGRYRTPRTERITADIAIMSMLYESTAIVSINGFFLLYQFIYTNKPHQELLLRFTKFTAVPLAIEWLFASMSLAIETRYQNLAVISVWRKDWRTHILVAVLNVLPLAVWTSQNLFTLVQAQTKDHLHQVSCKMPFSL